MSWLTRRWLLSAGTSIRSRGSSLKVEWQAYDAVVIRSTWDYVTDPDAFLDVLGEIERSGTPLFNGLDLVRWNIRKTYLRDLAERGVPVVPTIWRDRLEPNELPDLIEEVGTAEVVIKPVVGLNASGAFRLDAQTARSRADELCAYYADRALLVQPFLSAITTEGEFSLFYFNGMLSHTILKLPKAADFRVQEEHGGVIRAVETDDALREAGDAAMRAIGTVPLYARADFVRANGPSPSWDNPQAPLLADGTGTHRAVALPAHGQRSARAFRACAARAGAWCVESW